MARPKKQMDLFADASPTKEFFISMLTRDIGLIRAIIDLIDNCLDGGIRIRKNGKLNGLSVRIEFNKTSFKISDNCGGISLDIAKNYAFRFGRPAEHKATKHSVGQFGVGMKRSLFKIGTKFKIESRTINNSFSMDEDVKKWKKVEDWSFGIKNIDKTTKRPASKTGTEIVISGLHPSVREEFGLETFSSRLAKEVESAHQESLAKGLSISINQVSLTHRPTELLSSKSLKPGEKNLKFYEKTKAPVSAKIVVGVAKSDPSIAGWYIFCNGRMVLEADQTHLTGWGEGQGTRIPKYHNQYSRFRGFVFFDSDDAGKLPWNTTKTGVDIDSTVYKSVRSTMLIMMRPVIDFLNQLDTEKDTPDLVPFLAEELEKAVLAPFKKTTTKSAFAAPKPSTSRGKNKGAATGRIAYDIPLSDIDRAKKSLGVTSQKEVGEGTFAYYIEMECD